MLKLINLYIIDQIFTKAESEKDLKVGARAQILYINCLIHHFRELDLDENNLVAFSLTKEECYFERLKEHYAKLQMAGLVSVREDHVFFYDLWRDYLDMNQTAEPDDLGRELFQKSDLQLHIRRVYKIDEATYKKTVETFLSTQKAAGKKYSGVQDIKSHFINWCRHNIVAPADSTVKSNSERLGDE